MIRLLRTYLRPYSTQILIVLGLLLVQSIGNLYLPDLNGDIINKVISVFQITHDAKYPEDDVQHQYKYIGVASESPAS